ncbi:MAG TPA: hypothetical protein PLH94_01695 [Fimbriimonadaceae bacterium]|nr:hypothetical protein [Fimbriimonadaceae bacterium]
MNSEFEEKLKREKGLSRDEQIRLEMALDSREHAEIRSWVGELTDEDPSLAWRSALNERLHAVRTPVRQPKMRWRWASVMGLGLASALTLTVYLVGLKPTANPGTTSSGEKASVEANLLAAHQDGLSMLDLGTGSPAERATGLGQQNGSFSEVDLGTL